MFSGFLFNTLDQSASLTDETQAGGARGDGSRLLQKKGMSRGGKQQQPLKRFAWMQVEATFFLKSRPNGIAVDKEKEKENSTERFFTSQLNDLGNYLYFDKEEIFTSQFPSYFCV